MKGKILEGDMAKAEIKDFDIYKTQSRVTFRTAETLKINQKFQLSLDNGQRYHIQITSAPQDGNPSILVHGALLEEAN